MLCRSGQIQLISQDLHCWSHATFIPRAGLGRSGAAQGTGLDRQVLMCTSHASAVWIHLQILPRISFSILLDCYHVISWIEKISPVFTPQTLLPSAGVIDLIWVVPVLFTAPPCSTEQFWALFLHFRHFSIVPPFLLPLGLQLGFFIHHS